MNRIRATFTLLILAACHAVGQNGNYPYVLKTFAGNFPLGDGGPALQALLSAPTAVASDSAGNTYVLDQTNYRIRKIAPNGTISTVAVIGVAATDMKLGKDGNFYLTGPAVVFKVSPAGAVTVLAGNGTAGFSGDGGLAAQALVGSAAAIALDSAGNIFFADASRIREITLDGNIKTIAGTETAGYNGDSDSPGGKPAASAQLNFPSALAFDSSNNLLIADTFNYRIRKIIGIGITTVAGTGNVGQPVNGPATGTPMGVPHAMAIDGSGNIYVSDVSFSLILKIGTDGNLTKVAGTPTFGYSDGPANSTYVFNALGLAPDGSGGLYIAETSGNRVRQLSNGNVTTIAGRLHYAGDNGPATSALLYNPIDTATDAQGNVFILDSGNFRIRKVAPDGTISTFAGNGLAGTPGEGVAAASTALPQFYSMTMDAQGNLYLGAYQKIYKITAAGVISTFAGVSGAPSSLGAGDGGPATKASLDVVTALAADSDGNIYVGDCCISRVRKISPDGTISAFAGTGTVGYTGDGGLATSARLSGFGPLAVDAKGNVYIGDNGNNVVRMVTPGGIISTVAGNGTAGSPTEGASAKSPLTAAAGLTLDAAGNLYIMSNNYSVYRVDTAGLIHVISGSGTATVSDGVLANTTTGFNGKGIRVDANGDLLVADPSGSLIRKLVLDSPTGLAIADGNDQTGTVGTTLPKPLKVTVTGRSGVAVPNVLVIFGVSPTGSATLSAISTRTDSTGTAGVSLTLGPAAANITIAVAIVGSPLPGLNFTATATVGNPNCSIVAPVITSVKSLGDFGGFSTFGAGSWLEVKGSNLATNARLWTGTDFQGSNAPTSLDGTSVSINGNAGFVEYISAMQVNVQAPADASTGAVAVTVTNCGGTSPPVTVQKATIAPGMLAPASFNIGGKQYLVALFQDGVTYVGKVGLVAGVPFRPVKPQESITAYGIGFGNVTPAVAPGVVVSQANSVSGLIVSFGQTPASTTYAGLAPGNVGLYQFNVTVPDIPDGDYQINISAGGIAVQQTLYLTVAR